MTNAFANSPRQSVVTPIARAGFLVRRDIRRYQPGQVCIGPVSAGAFSIRNRRRPRFARLDFRMATKTSHHGVDQILTSLKSRRSGLKAPITQSPSARANKRPPANSECDQKDNNDERARCYYHKDTTPYRHADSNRRVRWKNLDR